MTQLHKGDHKTFAVPISTNPSEEYMGTSEQFQQQFQNNKGLKTPLVNYVGRQLVVKRGWFGVLNYNGFYVSSANVHVLYY